MSDQPKNPNSEREILGQICTITMTSGRRYLGRVIGVEKYTILLGNEEKKFTVLMKTAIESISPKGFELEPIGRAYQ